MLAILVTTTACGGGGAGNPDAVLGDTAIAIDAAPDAPPFCPSATSVDPATAHEVLVAGDTSAEGIFDPSIVYPAGASAGAMAYSAVPDQETIRTRIALSPDHGATWTMAAEINMPEVVSIAADPTECAGGVCAGKLISEVTSLVIDVDEPDANKRWKLFAHRYVVGAGVALHYRVGTITLQTAAQPQGPWTAPQKLIGWNGPSAYSSTGIVTNVNTIGGSASDCLVLTEPGAIWLPGALDLAVGCIYLDGATPKIRIELLRSTTHGASWVSVGTLLRPDDAACLAPGASLNGPDLFVADGHEYIAATPSDQTGYHGCMTFEIDDPPTGHVKRDGTGRAIVARSVTSSQFAGACTFSESGGGYALDIGFLQAARKFRIFTAGVTTP